jgi:aspartate kinase
MNNTMPMLVFKFGGASVKDAPAVKNLASIIKRYNQPKVIVVSAMGKTTNALEEVLHHFFSQDGKVKESFDKVYNYHMEIMRELFPVKHEIFQQVGQVFSTLIARLGEEPSMTYNFEYDQVVSYGEIISTLIVAAYIKESGVECEWIDVRRVIKTDTTYREARVNFEISEELARKTFIDGHLYLTQGFIGSTADNLTTTLGREGSDYTAALLAYFLGAESVTVWKDVPGVLNADPKWFDNTVKLDQLSYTDAIELAFYGASVIHPKTIQPLKIKDIPLWVKSFFKPEDPGTMIGNVQYNKLIPCFIFKMEQVLIDVYPRDLSFIAEDNLQHIFEILAANGLKVNIMQNTAVRFRICVDSDITRIPNVVEALSNRFQITKTENLELITIRYFDQQTIDRVMVNKVMLLEQRSHTTIQLLVRDMGD